MFQVHKTHSGQFTLSTSQSKEKWAGKKKQRGGGGVGGGVGVRFPPLSLPLPLFLLVFFLALFLRAALLQPNAWNRLVYSYVVTLLPCFKTFKQKVRVERYLVQKTPPTKR